MRRLRMCSVYIGVYLILAHLLLAVPCCIASAVAAQPKHYATLAHCVGETVQPAHQRLLDADL